MITAAPNTTNRSRWMNWQPKAQIITPSAPSEPTKPSKPCFVGFVGSPQTETSIKRGALPEQIAPPVDTSGVAIPAMPPGVRLVHWEPKAAPVVLTQYSVVTDVHQFIRMTLLELKAALGDKRWQAGHRSARDLVDRLEQCGVRLEIEEKSLSIINLPLRRGRENQ